MLVGPVLPFSICTSLPRLGAAETNVRRVDSTVDCAAGRNSRLKSRSVQVSSEDPRSSVLVLIEGLSISFQLMLELCG